MSRESLRRFGTVNFDKSRVEKLADDEYRNLFRDLLKNALEDAKMKWTDDFSLRLVVMENFPEDRSS